MKIRKAVSQDSNGLIELTALTPMKGRISLRIDRKPDFFALLHQRGDSIVVVAENDQEKIMGSFSAAKKHFMIDNSIRPVYYLGDLKVNPGYKKSTIAYRLIKAMQEEVGKSGIDLFICNTSQDNIHVFTFFQGRAGLPIFQETTTFNVYQILPRNYPQSENISTACSAEQLTDFYGKFFERYHFHPVISLIDNCINIGCTEKRKIVAAISLYDPGMLKQNVIIDFPMGIGITLRVLKVLKSITGIRYIPGKGDQLKILYVKYLALEPGHEEDLVGLIRFARTFAFQKKFHFLAIAVDKKDSFLNAIIKPLSSFNFRSHQFIASLGKNEELLEKIKRNIAYEDYSLI
jgi:hypothetical protein